MLGPASAVIGGQVQVFPSPIHGSVHAHSKLPSVLVQSALGSQWWRFFRHSSTSLHRTPEGAYPVGQVQATPLGAASQVASAAPAAQHTQAGPAQTTGSGTEQRSVGTRTESTQISLLSAHPLPTQGLPRMSRSPRVPQYVEAHSREAPHAAPVSLRL